MRHCSIVFWSDGCVHADGREFGPYKEDGILVTAEEQAMEYLSTRFTDEEIQLGISKASDFRMRTNRHNNRQPRERRNR
jgi:hypothetical protein